MTTDYSQPLSELRFRVDDRTAGMRLDSALVRLVPHRSRSFFRDRIKSGSVRVNKQTARPALTLQGGDEIVIRVELSPSWVDPETVVLEVIAEPPGLVVLNKRAGQIVHPTGATQGGTLLNALHARHRKAGGLTEDLPRVVHRLDVETSGVMVFAIGSVAAAHYGQVFETRRSSKIYLALLEGRLDEPRECDAPLGDDPGHAVHVRQGVRADGKSARSFFEPLAANDSTTLVKVAIHTGRLHQIRVHAAHLGHPVVGDPLYNPADEDFGHWIDNRERRPRANRPQRQLLHAWKLSVPSPTGETLVFNAPVPEDFAAWAPDIMGSWIA